jgi:hypothetical protein
LVGREHGWDGILLGCIQLWVYLQGIRGSFQGLIA